MKMKNKYLQICQVRSRSCRMSIAKSQEKILKKGRKVNQERTQVGDQHYSFDLYIFECGVSKCLPLGSTL